MDVKICREAIEKFSSKEHFRVLLFGASNTERYAGFMHWGGIPILQTYYKPDLAALDPVYAGTFVRYMQVVREIAARRQVFLVDQYSFFEKLPPNTLKYKLLLNDMHVNELGNMLMGIILLKHFQIDPMDIQHGEKLMPALHFYDKFIAVK